MIIHPNEEGPYYVFYDEDQLAFIICNSNSTYVIDSVENEEDAIGMIDKLNKDGI